MTVFLLGLFFGFLIGAATEFALSRSETPHSGRDNGDSVPPHPRCRR